MTSRTAKARSRRLAWAACGVLALVLSGWAALVILLPPARVLAIARAQLSAALRREVRLDRASVSPWPPVRIELKGLAISEPEGFSRGSSFEARSLDLNLNLFALLLRRAVVRDFTLEQPVLHLVLRGDGTTNFDGLLSAPPPGGAASGAAASVPFDLAVHTCSVRGGRVMVDDVRAARRTVFTIDSRIALSIAGATRIATEGRTKFSNLARGPLGAARGSDLDRSLSDLALTLFHRGVYDAAKKRLALEMLSLRLGRAEISFRGVVDDPGPRARVRLSANGEGVDFSEVLRALAAAELPALHGVSGSGRMGFALDVNGALTSGRLPVVTGRVAVRDAAFRYPEASASVNALSFTARLAPDSLAIGDLSARVSGQPVRASLFVTRFANPELRFHVSGALDLAAVAPMFAPREARLSGRVSLDVSGVGRARAPDAIALSGRADLSNVRIESPQLPRPMERVSGAVEFASARAAVRNLTGAAGQSSFTLDATLERPLALMAKPDSAPPADVDFTLRSPYLDLAELLPPTPGPALLPNARGTGRIEIGRLRQERLDVRNVSARVRFDPVTFEVPQFSLDGYGGAVAGEAKFDLRNPANPGFA
ncbi:MAG: AsmA family protein, partial [Candidatus Eisenbacteria bacterium]|nr:AsmA family protein [Candidatus Eisenbacteria bacterium]